MNRKLLYSSISLISVAAVGILVAIVMEITTGEPIYWLVMKCTAALFGIGGPLFGWALIKRRR